MDKKWTEGARGWFVFNFILYVILLISVTILCQHYRHGIRQASNVRL